jgi:hypothetical protein
MAPRVLSGLRQVAPLNLLASLPCILSGSYHCLIGSWEGGGEGGISFAYRAGPLIFFSPPPP